MKNLIIATITTIFLLACSANAQIQGTNKPGLIITPNRIELGNKQRSASVTVANNGTKRGYYRIQLVNKVMATDGKLVDATEQDDNKMFADKMLRISPRSVTLEPGASQSIRILVRKPKDLIEGEYRSHLSVIILPGNDENADATEDDGGKLVIAIQANYGVTIPVIYRNGNVASTAKLSNITYLPAKPGQDVPLLKFSVTRNGNASLYGDIKVIYSKDNGTETVVKFFGGLAVYTNITKRDFEIPLDDGTKINGGTIKVIYQEKENAGGKIIAQNELKL